MVSEIYSPWPRRPNKRLFAEYTGGSDSQPSLTAPPIKRRREQTLSPVTTKRPYAAGSATVPPSPRSRLAHYSPQSSVAVWLTSISPDTSLAADPLLRPYTCPALLDTSTRLRHPLTAETLSQMPQSQSQPALDGAASSTTAPSKKGIKEASYRNVLEYNGITVDVTGRDIPNDLRSFLNSTILRGRSSPPLSDAAVDEVLDFVQEYTGAVTEAMFAQHAFAKMLPFERRGLKHGMNCQWNTVALPNSPEYQHEVVAPKPDVHIGYSCSKFSSPWNPSQTSIVDSAAFKVYTQPADGVNNFPFLIIELKSEATGGSLLDAEHQAAGGGSQAVSALRWFFQQVPDAIRSASDIDTIAFSITMNHRLATFHVHWWSEEHGRYYMSQIRNFSSVSPADIRACHSTVKNIIDHALGERKDSIEKALNTLLKKPERWIFTRKRSAPAGPVTPSSSSSEQPRRKRRDTGSQER